MTRRPTPEFQRNRKEILANNPTCHWCKRAPATDADHLIAFDAGGSDNLDNLVPACKRCNSIRGAKHLNQKRAAQQQARDEHIRANGFFATQTHMTPTLSPNIQQTAEHSPALDWVPDVSVGSGRASPRLATPVVGYESYGGLICDFARDRLGVELFDWQRAALDGAFAHDETGKFVHSTALISSGRQNGKTTMLTAVVAWCLLELPRIWGRPVRIMSTAHELALATEVFEELREVFELIEESDLGKVTWAYGRHQVRMKDGSVYAVKAASSRKHGGTWDIICADEIWAISEETIFGAFRPSQIAVPSPLMFCTSTAGDESSRAFLKWREQALAIIDSGQPSDLFMAEWSLPNVDPLDERWWGYANPAMGKTITLEGLRSAAAAPDRAQFLRAHCNLWVAAAQSWMPPGRWETCRTDLDDGDGGIIAVDSAVDDSKYVGVWCRTNTQGEIVAHVEFATESIATMWAEIARVLDQDPKVKLAITPSLDLHTPERYQRRKQVWGYAELLKYTGTVRSLIMEDRVKWAGGGEMLGEHVNRAVLTKAQGSVVISSQRSPGPIECARCLIAAAAFVSRPGQTSKPSMGSAR